MVRTRFSEQISFAHRGGNAVEVSKSANQQVRRFARRVGLCYPRFQNRDSTSESQSYMRNYGTGMGAREMQLYWPQYICALKNDEAGAFQACVCGAGK
jgi:hypothetical protein